MADFFLRPPTLKAGNFEALLSIDTIFTILKVLNPLKRYFKNQEASYNFKLGFALSNRPYFNNVYIKKVPFLTSIALCIFAKSWQISYESEYSFCYGENKLE